MRRIGANRSQIVQPVDNLGVGPDGLVDFPPGMDVCGHLAGRERNHPAMVNRHAVGRIRGQLLPADRGVGSRDHRPRVRVGCRFAGEISGIELGDGVVEVVQLEYDKRSDLIVRVDFDDAQHLRGELRGPATADRGAREDEALAADCDDDERRVRDPDLGGGLHVCDLGISTVPDPRVYGPTAIIGDEVVGQYLRERIPVAGCEVRRVALGRLGLPRSPAAAPDGVPRPRTGRARRRVRRSQHPCLRGRTRSAGRFDPLRRCRISARNSSCGAPGLASAVPTTIRARARRSPRTAISCAVRRTPLAPRTRPISCAQFSGWTIAPAACVKPMTFRLLSLNTSGAYSCSNSSQAWRLTAAATRLPARMHALSSSRTCGGSGGTGTDGRSGSPRMRRALSASAAAPFRSYRSTARSAAVRAPAASPAAPKTVASVRQESP